MRLDKAAQFQLTRRRLHFTHPMPFSLTQAFVVALLASSAVRLWLDWRQATHVTSHRASVPKAFGGVISLEAHHKAADYTLAKIKLHTLSTLAGAAVLVGWTLLGGLDALNQAVLGAVQPRAGDLAYQLMLLAAVSVISGLIDLPESLYTTFKLEQRFGFNRTSFRLWLMDAVKGAVVGAAIGLPLAALVLFLMQQAGALWWLWAWGAMMLFQVAIMVIYPAFIAPWFNQFKPMTDSTLQARVQALMARCGFQAKGLYVMDGSRRSAHGNAYFTGMGASKRVVFFDTLLERLSHDEVEAVLAHELGHFHHKHIVRRVLMLAVMMFLAFALLGWLASKTWFYTQLGVEPNTTAPNDALALTLFMFVVPAFMFFITPIFSWLSRRDEFQADAYARQQSSGPNLSSALLKLYEDNAGTLTPDPMYVAFYASHPPASQRLAALSAPLAMRLNTA